MSAGPGGGPRWSARRHARRCCRSVTTAVTWTYAPGRTHQSAVVGRPLVVPAADRPRRRDRVRCRQPGATRVGLFDPGPAAAALPVDASLSFPATGAPAAPTGRPAGIRGGAQETDPAGVVTADRAVAVVLAVPAADRALALACRAGRGPGSRRARRADGRPGRRRRAGRRRAERPAPGGAGRSNTRRHRPPGTPGGLTAHAGADPPATASATHHTPAPPGRCSRRRYGLLFRIPPARCRP